MPKRRTWEERIRRAEEVGHFLSRDNQAANSWRSCAVGEKAYFPDLMFEAENDSVAYQKLVDQLDDLGCEFAGAVFDATYGSDGQDKKDLQKEVVVAKKVYTAIQKLWPKVEKMRLKLGLE